MGCISKISQNCTIFEFSKVDKKMHEILNKHVLICIILIISYIIYY